MRRVFAHVVVSFRFSLELDHKAVGKWTLAITVSGDEVVALE